VLQTIIRPTLPINLGLTLSPLRRGRGDPSVRLAADGAWWRATRTPCGPATTRIARHGPEIVVHAWGPGAEWALEAAPDVVGARDSLDGFDPPTGLIREIHRRMPGLRITRTRAVFEALVPTVIEQKVTGHEARRSYQDLVRTWGEPAPGPGGLTLAPSAQTLARLPYYELHPLGIEMRRATTVRTAAGHARRLDALAAVPLKEADRLLRTLPGIGPWTSAEVAIVALGNADAVSVGDYHLPHMVAWALAGEPRGSDERMLALLEPFQGHRGRVLRLIGAAGIGAPRFGPRAKLRSFRTC
jgi:3-methyladenine DNA glycosylase/8-oxoguanine DNA glycosylase